MPKNPHYASPLNIKLLDERLFGWTSVVGASVVSLGPILSGGQDKLESLAKGGDHTVCTRPPCGVLTMILLTTLCALSCM